MGTLSSQRRDGIFYANSISASSGDKRLLHSPEPNMLLKYLYLVTQMGAQWHISTVFNLQEGIISAH